MMAGTLLSVIETSIRSSATTKSHGVVYVYAIIALCLGSLVIGKVGNRGGQGHNYTGAYTKAWGTLSVLSSLVCVSIDQNVLQLCGGLGGVADQQSL